MLFTFRSFTKRRTCLAAGLLVLALLPLCILSCMARDTTVAVVLVSVKSPDVEWLHAAGMPETQVCGPEGQLPLWPAALEALEQLSLPEGFRWAKAAEPKKPVVYVQLSVGLAVHETPPGTSALGEAASTMAGSTATGSAADVAFGAAGSAAAVADSGSSLLLDSRWLAVPVPWNHDRLGYSFSDPECAPSALVALETIAAPWRAAVVDGLLPGESGYALELRATLNVQSTDSVLQQAVYEQLAVALPTPARPYILGAVGDIVIEAPGQAFLEWSDWDLSALLPGLVPYLRSRDLLLANLEAPVSLGGEPNMIKRFRFRHHPKVLDALREAGFDFLSFANNHTLDYGPEAFADTLQYLRQSGMAWAGAGSDLEEALRPAKLTLPDGTRLAVFAFADYPVESRGFKPADAAAGPEQPGILTDAELLRTAIAEAAAEGYFVVAMPHAGFEYVQRPHASIKQLYRSFVAAGADLVLGSHPHVLQGLEAYAGGVILYSLGNFLFTQLDEPPVAQKSAVFSFVMYDGQLRGYSLLPVRALNDYTVPESDRQKAEREFMALIPLIGE